MQPIRINLLMDLTWNLISGYWVFTVHSQSLLLLVPCIRVIYCTWIVEWWFLFIIFFSGYDQQFEVNKETGVISTTGLPLIWDKEYALTVQAIDRHGKKSLHACVSILVGLRPPQFTNMTYSLFVPESLAAREKWVLRQTFYNTYMCTYGTYMPNLSIHITF